MATERQIEANRRNAARSTGPKTDEGKDAARRNALKHGLTGSGVVLSEADQATVGDRLEAWAPGHASLPPRERWALVEMVRESIRIDRCHEEEWALRRRAAERAEACWDEDRRDQAEELGRSLAKRPSLVARRLAATPQGCLWLLERWVFLHVVLRDGGDWDDDQRNQAQDLVGVPAEFRHLPGPLDLPGGTGDPGRLQAHRLAFISAEFERLRRLIDGPAGRLDEQDRQATAAGLGSIPDPAVDRLRRYHAACHRRFAAASRTLALPGAVAAPASTPAPTIEAAAEVEDDPAILAEPPAPPRPEDGPTRPLNRHQRRALAQRQRAAVPIPLR